MPEESLRERTGISGRKAIPNLRDGTMGSLGGRSLAREALQMSSSRQSWLGFTMMCLGLFMAILDIQIVAAALPRIATSLHAPLDELSWVQTSYLMTEVIAIALSGRLARVLSTRWLFAGAALGFVLTSLACGLSHDYVTLIVWRTLQGLFAGTMVPT